VTLTLTNLHLEWLCNALQESQHWPVHRTPKYSMMSWSIWQGKNITATGKLGTYQTSDSQNEQKWISKIHALNIDFPRRHRAQPDSLHCLHCQSQKARPHTSTTSTQKTSATDCTDCGVPHLLNKKKESESTSKYLKILKEVDASCHQKFHASCSNKPSSAEFGHHFCA